MNKKNKTVMKKHIRIIIDVIIFALFIFADQFTKHLAVLHLKDQKPFIIIKDVFELNYLENTGAAFGMLKNQKALFVFISIIVLVIIAVVLLKTPNEKKYSIFRISLVLIASGAVGNSLIDRVRYDYVVDFLYFKLINFPIFNVADIFVTIGTALLAIVILFVYKEEDLDFLSFQKKTIRKIED